MTETKAEMIADLLREIEDLAVRIDRQQKRIERKLVDRAPNKPTDAELAEREDLRALLATMIDSRAAAQARLETFRGQAT